ncbi:peptide/nickel transport system substrate-binding protein [Saccharopolyspora lacisalsi]|uniref:Peptide/nickel transport system substrate-binding protein n=1 Tax=Halosaccharopolyspora lacisalsi TaxID=1000566 RepID=A0A839E061_9PSEU|nr:ABC transporter substrate-binding protein [Halosaccharopolyspora lacisalsi]MBA8824358.1 peptide/nickel transport system substrate-binding protein [Halosaccharopolyspora lacisalsi]
MGVASVAALTMALSACAGSGSGGGGEEGIIVGTTDSVPSLDPAKCYSYYCGTIIDNVGSTLVGYKPGETKPSPSLTTKPPKISEDGTSYTFTLKKGIKFQDGSKLTSKDVKFSLNRARWINHPEGAGFLLEGIDTIETPDPQTVVISLGKPDITFTSKLAYNVATILPSGKYKSPGKKIPDDAPTSEFEKYVSEELASAGPYKLADRRQGESITLQAWDGYSGKTPKNNKVLVKFFAKPAQMLAALKSDEIDVAFRNLTPQQRESLKNNDEIKIIKGKGASIRYLVLNPYLEPFGKKNVRKAVAAAIDRKRIIKEVYGGVGKPLYSMVPPTFDEVSVPAFKKLYEGKKPSDFIDKKVTIDLWFGTNHYGATESSLASTVARMLEETGMFEVNIKKAPWAQFSANNVPGSTGQYPAHLLGWYPDFLDPDNYIQPFYHSEQSFLRMYDNPKMDQLIQQEQTAESIDSQARTQTFAKIQQLTAEDAPIVPLAVNTPLAFVRSDITGAQKTMDASQVFRYYTIHHKDQG